jgi:hypothetical protein
MVNSSIATTHVTKDSISKVTVNHQVNNAVASNKNYMKQQLNDPVTNRKLIEHHLSLAQIKEGLSRVQKFYYTYHRLPNYVSYGTNKIPIEEFQEMIANNGLKIKDIDLVLGKPVYITSDYIKNSKTDKDRLNNIVQGLRCIGVNAYNMGLGPTTHLDFLKSSEVPGDALIINIYGGACAGTLYEMGTSWYKSIRGTRKVFTIFWSPCIDITGLEFLERAHDDNFSPASFKGLAHPDQYLLENGYNYMCSGNVTSVVDAIFYQSTY